MDEAALAATLATTNPRETIRPSALDATIADAGAALGSAGDFDGRLVLGTTIGEGGMAIVRSATQTSLGREVAVKTLREQARGDDETPRLLREAWITGALEHPNIVPVHDLGKDAQGRPLIVLKRIEGRPWSALIDQPSVIRARFGMDALEWNAAVLANVCHAVAFAHSRNILHRDLKPQNIMVGGFGEVYVLDWGIAVSLVDDGTGRLPLAADCHDLAGTLAYMAPEMLGDAPLSIQTDVYLLGAILFEIITGNPPHVTPTIAATLTSIALSELAFPASTPGELAAICRRAMARDPADRFPTVDAFRIALQGFLEHRGSAALAREAQQRLAELEGLLAASEPDRVATYQLFGQCRFGFQAALRAWPENIAAREALDRALRVMATHELDHGDTRAAAILLAEAKDVPAELRERLARVEKEATQKARRLERLDADQDVMGGSRGRAIFLIGFGLLFALMPLAVSIFPAIPMDHALAVGVSSVIFVTASAVAYKLRAELTKTAQNRGALLTVLLGVFLHGLTEAVAWSLGLDMPTTMLVAVGLWVGVTGTAAIFLDRALLVPTFGFLVAIIAMVRAPDQRFWAIGASLVVLFVTMTYVVHQSKRGRRIYGIAEWLRPKD